MKVVFMLIMGLLGATMLVAQSPEVRAQAVADQFCNCVEETYSELDKDVKKAMVRMVRYQLQNEPQDLERYMKRLPAELIFRIQEQATQFKQSTGLANRCVHKMEQAMDRIDLEDPLYERVTESSFSQMIQQELQNDPACEFAALLLKLGILERPESNSQVRIGQTRSRETVAQ